MSQSPSLGRIVHYKLSQQDADAINRRREDAVNGHSAQERNGFQVHVGNAAKAEDIFPAMIVRVFEGGYTNLQVFLDGNDTYWATSRIGGEGVNRWLWPPRV